MNKDGRGGEKIEGELFTFAAQRKGVEVLLMLGLRVTREVRKSGGNWLGRKAVV